jgi:hypothetical protein
MFDFIRKHQGWGIVFIAIVILSFVVFFSPNQGSGGTGGRADYGSVGGRAVTQEEFQRAAQGAQVGALLFNGQRLNLQDERALTQVLQRVFLLRQAEGLGIQVPDQVVADRILRLPYVQDERTGRFSQAAYDNLLGLLQREGGITRADFEAYHHDEAAVEHLAELTGLTGTLVTPRDAAARYRAEHEQFTVQLAVFPASNYTARVDLSPEAVARHFTNTLAEYRVPEQLRVAYVRFALTNHLAEADATLAGLTNLPALMQGEYERRGTNTFLDAAGAVKPPEAALAEIREQLRRQAALAHARTNANRFANQLYRRDASTNALAALAAEQGLPVQASLPFTQARPPFDLRVPASFTRAAFALSAGQPFATPVTGEDGVYVYAFLEKIPASLPPLETVSARVSEQLKATGARALARQEAEQFAAAVTNALAQGRAFEAAAAELGVAPLALPPFTRATPSLPELGPRLTLAEVIRAVEPLPAGRLGAVETTEEAAFVAYLQARQPAPETQLKTELPDYLAGLRRAGGGAAFQEWAVRRLQAAELRLPGAAAPAAPAVN